MANNSETISQRISVTRSTLQQQQQPKQQQQQQEQQPRPGLRHHSVLKAILLIACCWCALLPATAALAKGYHDDRGGTKETTASGDDTTAEILELPHAFRHQEHYAHRIEQAVNDFKRAQQQQQQPLAAFTLARNGSADALKKHEVEQQQHHRRHEHKMQQQHHLRHHHNNNNNNNHHEHNSGGVLPPLRHQRHQMQRLHQQQQQQPPSTTTTENINAVAPQFSKAASSSALSASGRRHSESPLPRNASLPTKPPRYFDRDGLFRVGGGARAGDSMDKWWKSMGRSTEGPWLAQMDSVVTDEPSDTQDGARRYSLRFPPDEDDNESDMDYESDEASPTKTDDDDYSYEDDDDDDDDVGALDGAKKHVDTHFVANNEFPSSFSAKAAKASVKRYTNPFRSSGSPSGFLPLASTKEKRTRNANDFTAEKWQRIEHEHYEQKRQREMQTRDSAKRQQLSNDQDPASENIYSRWYTPGTLTRHKQETLGTPEDVHEARRAHAKQQRQHKALASAHNMHIMAEASCRIPQRRIERIQHDLSKIYTPHCTILHRCADDTGCCRTEQQTCAPKRTQTVDLYFFVKSVGNNRGSIERLTFVNHTECHCVDRFRQLPPNGGNDDAARYTDGGVSQLRHATILNCNCPKPYEKILQEDGYCRCDCSSGNTGCDWLKRGLEHFSMIERKCIMEGRCKLPTCEYGHYMKKHGRCPRRSEQLSDDDDTTNSSMMMLATNTLPLQKYH